MTKYKVVTADTPSFNQPSSFPRPGDEFIGKWITLKRKCKQISPHTWEVTYSWETINPDDAP